MYKQKIMRKVNEKELNLIKEAIKLKSILIFKVTMIT